MVKAILTIAIPLLAFLSVGAWSLSSPVGATPDDDFHLASIWCGLGERPGLCENPNDDSVKRFVPTPVAKATCYAFHPGESAACWKGEATGLTEVKRANVDGLYPRLFYGTMSLFASPNVGASVMAMKIFNGAFCVGLLTATWFGLPRRLRAPLVISVVTTAVPLGLFIYGSTNPSSWALVSAAMVWVCTLGALQSTGRRRAILLALTLLGVVVGGGARADSAIYSVFGILLALLLGLRMKKGQVFALIIAVIAIALSVGLYLSAGQGSSIVGGLDFERPPLTAAQHISNFLSAPTLWMGALGGWGLGWLDTSMPAAVTVLAGAVFWGAIFVGLGRANLRRSLAVAATIAALWLIPVVLLAQSRVLVGELIQPRYLLPLMIILVGVASQRVDADRAWRGMRGILAAIALSFANVVALHINIQRYTTGLDRLSIDPGREGEWWWAYAPSPMVVWVGGSVTFAALFLALWILVQQSTKSVSSDDAPSLDMPQSRAAEADGAPSTALAAPGTATEPVP